MKIQLSESEIKTIIKSLDICYNKGIESISQLRELNISESTIKTYLNEINIFADIANRLSEQIDCKDVF